MEQQDLARRLAEIQDALLALPDDAFAEKYGLLKERDALRDQTAEYAKDLESQRSDADLLAELTSLRKQLKRLAKQKINLVSQAGGGSDSGEMGNLGAIQVNARMMEAHGADRIQARIAAIQGLLAERGVEVD